MLQIKFENITKEYDQSYLVLDRVSFGVEKGEFLFIVGPSGAGKSTLVRLLIREIQPTGGKILFSGLERMDSKDNKDNKKDGSKKTSSEMVDIFTLPCGEVFKLRRKIGVVFQDFKVLNSKTVFENVAVSLEVVDSPKEVINDLVPNVLGLVGLSGMGNKFPKQLSGGEKQRLSIARALAHEPDVLVADEPTGMIDPDSADKVLEVLEEINRQGTTVIMATHDQGIVNKMEKRVIRIEQGKLVSDEEKGKYTKRC